uniref:Small ribosomal subunit protein uS3c n=1 Tax=Neogoniolithon spectabile TaxID=231755 RepID=A0A3G3MGV1_9FLOR|nr:ribosomal protein S3 [Neogoniolithon spectabile]AYR06031.1 ribosomal protein S3 [Neogoniolithon spectabile]
MGQKTHPLGFRLDITQGHKSLWFANKKQYSKILEEDFLIRNLISKRLKQANITKIQIARQVSQVEIDIKTARPGIILGKSGNGIDELKAAINLQLAFPKQIRINVIEITEPDKEASIVAEFIAQQLEKRIAFRRVLRQSLQRTQRANIKGIKIQVSGRLNGAEIARSEWIREGRVPLQTIRANIDYSYQQAQTIYGVLGIKVWLFKGEIFNSRHRNSLTD